MPPKKPSKPVAKARKPKFKSKRTKCEKRKIVRRLAREAKPGKKPLAEPLTIAPAAERNAAFKKGKMVFYDGRKKLSIPIHSSAKFLGCAHTLHLAGVYKIAGNSAGNKYVGLFFTTIASYQQINIHLLVEKSNGVLEPGKYLGYAAAEHDLGHMEVRQDFKRRGLALKAALRGERHVRSTRKGKHLFKLRAVHAGFEEIIKKLDYRVLDLYSSPYNERVLIMQKNGKHQPKDNLNEFVRIEAIDPKTGKERMFSFKIGG